MSTVYIMNTDTRTKILVWFWYLQSVGCTNETKKATRYVPIACAWELLILTHTEHASTTSPVNKTQKYDCKHQDKGTDQIWNFRDDVCGIES